MEVELDLWSSRSNDAVDHILSDVDCLGDVVADVDVDEFMLACSSAEASQVAGPDEHAASFTPEHALRHDDLTASVEMHQHHHQHLNHHSHHLGLHQTQPHLQQHHQMVAGAQHMNLNSLFDETLVSHHHHHHQQQQQHQQPSNGFQHPEQLHFEASRLTPHDLQNRQHPFEQQPHFGSAHQNDLNTLNSLVIEHQSGAPFVHQFAGQSQQQASSSAPNSSLVAARVDHCYITAESPAPDAQRASNGADQLEPVSTSISLPDRAQLQMLLESRPQPISCPLGESPLIAAMNSKSQEPLSQSRGATRRRQSQATSASSPKRQVKRKQQQQQQQQETLHTRLDGFQPATVISSSEQAAGQQKAAGRNNNPKRAKKTAAGAREADRQLDAGQHQVSGQISPTLSSSSSSGVSSQSSNYSDELAGSQLDDAACSQPDSAGQATRAGPANKRRRQQVPAGSNKRPAPGRKTTSVEVDEATASPTASKQASRLASSASSSPSSSSSSQRAEKHHHDKLAISAALSSGACGSAGAISSSLPAKSASQLNFEANLSAKSREKLNSLSSCLIQPLGLPLDQHPQHSGSQPSSSSCSSSASRAPAAGSSSQSSSSGERPIKAPSQPSGARQRASVSSSSSGSSCSSMSPLAGSPPSSLAGFAVGPAPSSTTCSSGSSPSSSSCASSSCSSFSSLRSPASERLASPVSSASCSPTMQLGSSTANSAGPNSGALPATSSSSCSFASSCSSSAYSAHQSAALISSQDWKSAASGQSVQLTEEERRTLLAAGYPIPQKFPLSKAEERSLKKIRRKIKNKISAQESRRKKKEYMEELEKRVQLMELRISELERENERLLKDRRALSSPSSAPSNASSKSQAANRLKRSQPRSRQGDKNQTKNSNNSNKEPARARAHLPTADTMTSTSPPTPTPQAKSLDLLRSFTLKQEPRAADAQLVITQPREQTQTAQQVVSFQLVGACESLARVEQHNQQAGQVGRSAPDSAGGAQPAARRKDSIQSQANDDDKFIDQILLSQERQEAADSAGGVQTAEDEAEGDLVANLVGGCAGAEQQIVDVAEPADIKVERHEMVVESV